MKVLKFGGTSVGSVENMQMVKEIICNGEHKIVVLSAMSGTTNALVEISELIRKRNVETSIERINQLQKKYNLVLDSLIEPSELKQEATNYVDGVFDYLRSCVAENYSELLYNKIVAQGELISTYLFTKYLNQEGVNARLLSAFDFMRIDKSNEPDDFYIKQNLQRIINIVV